MKDLLIIINKSFYIKVKNKHNKNSRENIIPQVYNEDVRGEKIE